MNVDRSSLEKKKGGIQFVQSASPDPANVGPVIKMKGINIPPQTLLGNPISGPV